MKTSRILRTTLALLAVGALALPSSADDKNLLKKGQAPPNVMVILSNTQSMSYLPYLQSAGNPKYPPDGQYQDSPYSKFGIAKAVLRNVIQQNSARFNFGISWYAYNQEIVATKHWSYKLTDNQTNDDATSDFPGDAFAEPIGTYEEWGTDGRGPISGNPANSDYTFMYTAMSGAWFGTAVPGATGTCLTDVCAGYVAYLTPKQAENRRVIAHAVPAGGAQPYGRLTVTVVKEYQKQTGNNVWTTVPTPAGNAGTVTLTYSAATSPAGMLPNVYSGVTLDNGLYMGFFRNGGKGASDWNLNSNCGGWFVQNGMPAVAPPRDYWNDNACTNTICQFPPQQSVACVMRYTRPQSSVVHYNANGTFTLQSEDDPAWGTCSPSVVHTQSGGVEDMVTLVDFNGSHIPESNMFKNVDDYFNTMDCFKLGVRGDDPNKECRTGAVILLSDTFSACGPDCSQNATAKYLQSLNLHKVHVYVISLGDVDSPTSATAKEAHCIAIQSGSETAKTQGVFFVSSTDPAQVAIQLSDAFAAILARIDEAVEDFASATVSSVQAGNGQMAFLATFNGRQFRSVWDGALRGYVLQNDGGINPPDNLNPSDSTPCVTTIKDINDPQNTVPLQVPCNDPAILKWNSEMGLAFTPVGGTNGVPDLASGATLSTSGSYSDTSNDTPHTIPIFHYPGRRIVWSLPKSVYDTSPLPATLTLPINGAENAGVERVPEMTLSFLNSPAAPWWKALKVLLTPQALNGAPPFAGSVYPCTPPAGDTAPCTVNDTDAGRTIRFIRGDRNSVINEELADRSRPVFPSGDPHYYDIPGGGTLKLGDIFHSNPQLVGEPENFFYYTSNLHGYPDFFRKYKHRRRILYAGGNDGLLHAFDVAVWGRGINACPSGVTNCWCTDGTSNCYDWGTGAELFAYAPRSVMQNFKRLKDAIGMQQPTDEWTVDGAPSAADVYIDTNNTTSPTAANRKWHTVLVGTQREGSPFEGLTTAYDTNCQSTTTTAFQNNASSVYALDVTTPEPLDGSGNESTGGSAAPGCLDGGSGCPTTWPRVLWEFQDPTTDASGMYSNMGESWSKPGIGRICLAYDGSGACTDERFVALFGGGFDRERRNLRGNWFYIVDVETGFVLYKVSSGTSTLGGQPFVNFASIPSEPSAIDVNGDGFLDVVYFGDLLGQMWRLDLTSLKLDAAAPTTRYASKLTKADGSALYPFLVFQAPQPTAADKKYYPIYYRPAVVALGNTSAGVMKLGLAFGTGDRDDVGATCPNVASNVTRTTSYNQRYYFVIDDPNTTTTTESTSGFVTIASATAPNLATNPTRGWVLLLGTSGPVTAERVITNSLVANQYIYFFTAVPAATGTTGACPPPSTCSSGTVPYEYVMFYANGNPVPGQPRATKVPDSSFATDPIYYVSGNNQGNIGFTTNHGAFKPGKSQTSTRGTLKNWKEN